MGEFVGRPNGRYGSRLASIPAGARVEVVSFRADDGTDVRGFMATYVGPVYDVSMARVRLDGMDPRFTASNISGKPDVMDLAVDVQYIQRRIPKAWRRRLF